jgi:hypothetical protein
MFWGIFEGIPIIKPKDSFVFIEPQGSRFREESYQYRSNDGLMIRSLDECFYHRYLAYYGIAHTYEPDLLAEHRIYKRPDFGIANNFLVELCRTETAAPRRDDTDHEVRYKENMCKKREIYLDHGFNIVELYYGDVWVNGKNASQKCILGLIAKHNDRFRVKENRGIHFEVLKGNGKVWKLRPSFYRSDEEEKYTSAVVDHYFGKR